MEGAVELDMRPFRTKDQGGEAARPNRMFGAETGEPAVLVPAAELGGADAMRWSNLGADAAIGVAAGAI